MVSCTPGEGRGGGVGQNHIPGEGREWEGRGGRGGRRKRRGKFSEGEPAVNAADRRREGKEVESYLSGHVGRPSCAAAAATCACLYPLRVRMRM